MSTTWHNAIIYCESAFNTPNGKTAHGLVRFTRRYKVVAVVDSRYHGQEAGTALDGKDYGVPILGSIEEAVGSARTRGCPATHLVLGLAPDGGRLSPTARQDVRIAVGMGLNVDSGLHDFLSEDQDLAASAVERGVTIRDIRKPPPRSELHFFTGEIEQVSAFKVAVLGTDSAVGKRTTAWKLIEGFENRGYNSVMIGTGQTAWFQGAQYSIVMDALINDFVSGEIEHIICKAWKERKPDVIVIEGQGSLMNPAYPGGFEILAAARPDVVVMQHAPARKEYDGFPGYPIHPLSRQIEAVEIISSKPVVAVSINHEGLKPKELSRFCDDIQQLMGIPTADVLVHGPGKIVDALVSRMGGRAVGSNLKRVGP